MCRCIAICGGCLVFFSTYFFLFFRPLSLPGVKDTWSSTSTVFSLVCPSFCILCLLFLFCS